jgi:3-oxoadipate CoA-transferase beta subunit
MAWRAAQDIPDGAYVNLGIGIPEMVADHVPADREVVYHSENGVLGFGPTPPPEQRNPDLINAGKKPVSLLPGAAFFHHADSFAMIRGGHVDFSILGAMQVATNGDIANWSTGVADAIPAVGGAMDLVAGARTVLVITEHTTRDGQPKLLPRCIYPLTGAGVVSRIYTNLAVVDIGDDTFHLQEIASSIDIETVTALTAGTLVIADGLRTIAVP